MPSGGVVGAFLRRIEGIEHGGRCIRSRVDGGRFRWRVAECTAGGGTPAALLPARAQDAAPTPDLPPAEMLAANLRKSLQRQAELLDLPLNPEDTRLSRLISDVANQNPQRSALRASEETLRAKRDGSRQISPYLQSRVEEAERRVQKLRPSTAGAPMPDLDALITRTHLVLSPLRAPASILGPPSPSGMPHFTGT